MTVLHLALLAIVWKNHAYYYLPLRPMIAAGSAIFALSSILRSSRHLLASTTLDRRFGHDLNKRPIIKKVSPTEHEGNKRPRSHLEVTTDVFSDYAVARMLCQSGPKHPASLEVNRRHGVMFL